MKAPNIPTGPTASQKPSKSKVMNPMPKAGTTQPGTVAPKGSSSVKPS